MTYTRRHAYHTLSNKAKVVKTPGGKLVAHYHKKSAKGPRCGDCGISLPGVSSNNSNRCRSCKRGHRSSLVRYRGRVRRKRRQSEDLAVYKVLVVRYCARMCSYSRFSRTRSHKIIMVLVSLAKRHLVMTMSGQRCMGLVSR